MPYELVSQSEYLEAVWKEYAAGLGRKNQHDFARFVKSAEATAERIADDLRSALSELFWQKVAEYSGVEDEDGCDARGAPADYL